MPFILTSCDCGPFTVTARRWLATLPAKMRRVKTRRGRVCETSAVLLQTGSKHRGRSTVVLAMPFIRYRLLFLLLCLCQCSMSAPQNCSNTLTINPGQSCECVRVGSIPRDLSLSTVLLDSLPVVNSTDCLQLNFNPGNYSLTGLSIPLNYSVVFRALQGGVTITCALTCPNEAARECTTGSAASANDTLRFRGGMQARVEMEGIEFHNCTEALVFDELEFLSINNCTFTNMRASALDIFNCVHTQIMDSLIQDSGSSRSKPQYRGNSGGISLGFFHNASSTQNHSVSVRNTTLRNNSALLPQENFNKRQTDLALNNNFFFGRGGGLGVYIKEQLANISIEIIDCTFENNYADAFGGGMYFNIDGDSTSHQFAIKQCLFKGNAAGNGSFGGGIQIAFLNRNSNTNPTECAFEDCMFINNSAAFGGGLSSVQTYSQGQGNMVSVARTVFENNTAFEVGSGLMFGSLLYIQNRVRSQHYRVEDCNFRRNNAPGGTFGAGFINVDFYGNNTFEFNVGSGLRLAGSLAGVHGELSFIGNNAENVEGGALYISAFGQVKLYRYSHLNFINNTGRIGAAIVVNVQRSSQVFSELIFNPQCFLLNYNTTLPPSEWDNVTISFSGNRAQVGPAIYISHLSLCSWFSAMRLNNKTFQILATFNITKFTEWPVFKFTGSNTALALNSTSQRYYIQTEPTRLTSVNATDTAFPMRPGQTQRLSVVGIDQLENPTYLLARLSDSRGNINSRAFSQAGDSVLSNMSEVDLLRFTPALLPIQPSTKAVDISYGFAGESSRIDIGQEVQVLLDTPYNVRSVARFNFSVLISDCLPGFVLSQRLEEGNLQTCSCVNSNFKILTCNTEHSIVLRDGYWASSETKPIPHLDLTVCPASYCSCQQKDSRICETLFFQDDPDLSRQCHASRRGTLCGECVNGTGAGVLRPNCRECSSNNNWAVGLLVLGDIVGTLLILLSSVALRYSFPHSMRGFLFYVQTVYYTTEYFPSSFWDVRQYMLYVGSFLGLYFPWDFCLGPGMSTLSSVGLMFIPSVVATVVAAIVVLSLYCYGKITSSTTHMLKRAQKKVWHGVWALVLLLYTPLTYTCFSLLHCPGTVARENGEETALWFLNGEVECFRDPLHSGLGALAIIVIMLLILLIPAVFLLTYFGGMLTNKLPHSSMLESIKEVLTYGYQDYAKWWPAWELLRRLLLVAIVIYSPGRTVVPLFIIAPAFALHIFYLPYHKWWQNTTEAIVLVNYLLLVLLRSTQRFLDSLSSYSGTGIPSSRGHQLPSTNPLTWFFFVFYYFPLVFALIFCIGWLVRYIAIYTYSKRRPRKNTAFTNMDEYGEFHLVMPDRTNVTTTELNIDSVEYAALQ